MLRRLILVIAVVGGVLGLTYNSAFAYNVDGSLLDWGIDFTNPTNGDPYALNYLDNNLPSGGLDIDVVHEDNATSYNSGKQSVGPGYTAYNTFDAEAIYFDNDATYGYIAIVTGLKKAGDSSLGQGPFRPGDIGISKTNAAGGYYEYGIDIVNGSYPAGKALLYKNPTWGSVAPGYYTSSDPFEIISPFSSTYYWVDFAYSGNQYSHYVMEAQFLLGDLGINANSVTPLKLHWTMGCGNDVLILSADANPIPEPASLSLLGLGLLGILGLKKKSL